MQTGPETTIHTQTRTRHTSRRPPGTRPLPFTIRITRKISVTIASGTSDAATSSYGYDSADLTSLIAPKEQTGQPYAGQKTIMAFDERNRPKSTTDALSHVTSYMYDAGGRKLNVTHVRTVESDFDSYDAMNRLLEQTVKQTPGPDAVTKYTYYRFGSASHDARSAAGIANSSSDSYVYAYDTTGRKVGLTYPLDSHSASTSKRGITMPRGERYIHKSQWEN